VAERNATTGAPVGAPIFLRGGSPVDVAFAPHGRTIAVSGWNGAAYVVDPVKRATARLPVSGIVTPGIAFSPDGTKIATTGWDGAIRLWDARTRKRIATLTDPDQDVVASVAWSPDGRTLAVTDWESKLRLFDVASRREVGPPFALGDGQQNPYAAFAPDGQHVVVSDDTGRVWIFPASVKAWDERACSIAGRNFTQSEWRRFLPGRRYAHACGRSSRTT
jgi:WD40 repeat protein